MAGVHCSEDTPTDLNVTGLTSTCNWFPAIVYTLKRNEFDDNIAIIYAECLFIRPLHINNTCCMTSLSAVFWNYCYCEERGNRINIPNKWVRSIIPTVHNSDSPLLRHFGCVALFRQPITARRACSFCISDCCNTRLHKFVLLLLVNSEQGNHIQWRGNGSMYNNFKAALNLGNGHLNIWIYSCDCCASGDRR